MEECVYDELQQIERRHWWFRARRQIVWSLVRRFLGDAAEERLRVCELGCGTGGNLVPIAAQHDVIGIECSTRALSYAQGALGSRVRYGRLPSEIDLPSGHFDLVLMTDVLEHIEDDDASASTALRLLRPDGIVVATVPAYQWLYSPHDARHHHFRRYGKRQFARIWDRPGAQTELLSFYNSLLFPIAASVRCISKLIPKSDCTSAMKIPSNWINEQLARVMSCEAHLLGRAPLPFGLSLIAVIRQKTQP